MTANVLNRIEQPGSGNDNKYIFGGSVETEAGQSLKKVYLPVDMTNISSAAVVYLPCPVAGTITKITTIINGAIATANAILTGRIGSTAITSGAVTIPFSGSAAGQVNSTTPTALNTVVAGNNINFTANNASTNTVRATIVVEITLS
ncbi:MAG: hypothetical protein RLZZ418_885 [Pseudomonadota bacterium]|jgi:hypothetical protein